MRKRNTTSHTARFAASSDGAVPRSPTPRPRPQPPFTQYLRRRPRGGKKRASGTPGTVTRLREKEEAHLDGREGLATTALLDANVDKRAFASNVSSCRVGLGKGIVHAKVLKLHRPLSTAPKLHTARGKTGDSRRGFARHEQSGSLPRGRGGTQGRERPAGGFFFFWRAPGKREGAREEKEAGSGWREEVRSRGEREEGRERRFFSVFCFARSQCTFLTSGLTEQLCRVHRHLRSDQEHAGTQVSSAVVKGKKRKTDFVVSHRGMDKILQSQSNRHEVQVTNDGATILKAIHLDNPAAKVLVNISKTQDSAVGDGTTSVCVLAGELIREAERLIQSNLHPQVVIAGLRVATATALAALENSAQDHGKDAALLRKDLENIARTTLSSKILRQHKDHFATLAGSFFSLFFFY